MMDAALLFRRCRHALGLSTQGMADALYIETGRTVRKWESGEYAVPGPAWLALRGILGACGEAALAQEIAEALEAGDIPARRS